MAFWETYQSVGARLDSAFAHSQAFVTATGDAADRELQAMFRDQLVARDRQSMVILGDPAVALPPPA